ncbi:hypothetical protein [Virgibacillus sp. JSM 102003]|uniref:hypothetical protein n=1 Tax=Virgibacillus sp. JSM 102003 TaxID=1562108 RepID=UPI0035BFA749
MSRETVMLIGIALTFIVGIFNYLSSRRGKYIDNLSAERIKWINNVREQFSYFNKNVFIQANNIDKFPDAKPAVRAFGYDPSVSYKASDHIRGGEPYYCRVARKK